MSKQRKPGLHDANRQPRSRPRNSTTPAVAVKEEMGGSTLQRKPPGTETLAVSNTENSVASVKQSRTSSAEEGTTGLNAASAVPSMESGVKNEASEPFHQKSALACDDTASASGVPGTPCAQGIDLTRTDVRSPGQVESEVQMESSEHEGAGIEPPSQPSAVAEVQLLQGRVHELESIVDGLRHELEPALSQNEEVCSVLVLPLLNPCLVLTCSV